MPLTTQQRADVVRAAKDWMGTPYHHQARVKGAGVDCAMFPLAVYQECGILPADFQPPEYSMQWHLHQSEEMYLNTIEPFVREIGERDPQPADFVIFKFGRAFSHGAIVVAWPLLIHSYIPHGVTLADALIDGQLIGREYKMFTISTADERG